MLFYRLRTVRASEAECIYSFENYLYIMLLIAFNISHSFYNSASPNKFFFHVSEVGSHSTNPCNSDGLLYDVLKEHREWT